MPGTLDRAARIEQALNSFHSSPLGRTRPASEELAKALQWDSERLEHRILDTANQSHDVTRVTSGGQGIAVFSYSTNSPTLPLIQQAALYAYHASIEWGLVANEEELTVFNSHWIRNKTWFELPSVRWGNLTSGLDILEGVTPTGMQGGLIERIAARFAPADEILLPVDDALVARLDYWRQEMARFVPSATRIDETIHKLFAQLFVLRAVEDRNLASGLIPLGECLGSSDLEPVNTAALSATFDYAATNLQTELFSKDTIQEVPAEVMAGVISDLYKPRHLPSINARYNFSWIDADVLGRAYEKYLSQILQPGNGPSQLNLLRSVQPKREIEVVKNKKTAGIYYTPPYLVSYLSKQAVDRFLRDHPNHLPRIVDPSCGSGSFLTGAVAYLKEVMRSESGSRILTRQLVIEKRICGIDSDPRAVLLAKLSLWLRLTEEPNALPLPALDEVIIHGDSLSDEPWSKLPLEFDIVLGNPPFVPTGNFLDRADLESRFVSAKGRFDYSYLFVETSIRHLRQNGVLAMVLPNRLYRNRDAGTIRAYISDETALNIAVDFGSNEVFRGVSAYIGLIVATKTSAGRERSPVRVLNVTKIAPRLMNLILSDASGRDLKSEFLESFEISSIQSGEPWLLLSPSVKSARLRLQEQSVELSTLAEIFQGIKVGANDIFLLSIISGNGQPIVQVRNGLGDIANIEAELLHPVAFGTNIESYSRTSADLSILYTYLDGVLISEAELKVRFPLTMRYLDSYSSLLGARVSVKESGREWYELVRHRDQKKLERPKLLMRDLAITTAFAMDDVGGTYIVGGTAVVPTDISLLKPLLAYLNSSLVNWYLSPTTPSFKGSFQKFEPQHISSIPVLTAVIEDDVLRDELSSWVDIALSAKANEQSAKFDETIEAINRRLSMIIGVDPTI